jgi:hypothetical protein
MKSYQSCYYQFRRCIPKLGANSILIETGPTHLHDTTFNSKLERRKAMRKGNSSREYKIPFEEFSTPLLLFCRHSDRTL